ncbi:S8 family serine peptidase [Svornostia abyssi]|uniref:S8 family serine peptidase n=1 Tax=Svornostia abyssi TaxID=2898438 RepID=A0ABY5PM61_9ACTN|nr:S8 family serine peptidase [Parviterribacteraceae bacterium J379]
MHHQSPRPRRGAASRHALTGALVAALAAAAATAPAALAAPSPVVDTTTQTAPPAAFDRLAAQAEDEQDGRTRVIVTLKARFDRTEATSKTTAPGLERRMRGVHAKALEALAGTDHGNTKPIDGLPYVAVDASEEAIRALEASGAVASIQTDRTLEPLLATSTQVIESASQVTRGWSGSSRVVAVIDTGIQPNHPFFEGRIIDPACFATRERCPDGSTAQVGPGAATALDPHGTHVAGIAAGKRFGTLNYDGVAPDARIMPIRVSNFLGSFQSDIMQSLAYVRQRALAGVPVASVNLSMGDRVSYPGTDTCDTDPLKTEIDTLVSMGIPTVIASGNAGETDRVYYPACISTAVTVGSASTADAVSNFSNATQRVDLLAPGEGSAPGTGIVSAFFDVDYPFEFNVYQPMVGMRGTSMAAPHVAGAWATYLDRYPGSSVAEVLAAFQRTGKPLLDTRNGINLTRSRINVSAALARYGYVAANNSASSSYTPGTQANSMGATNTVTRSGTGTYTVSMPKLGSAFRGNAHVETYLGSANRCKVATLGASGTTTRIGVRCTTPAGTLTDAPFVARFEVNETKRTATAGYLTSLDTTSPTHTPELTFQANSTGATNTVTRNGVGRYTATLPGFTAAGIPHVTAVGSDTNMCQVSTWATTSVAVLCFTRSGALADTAFSLTTNGQSVFTTGRGASMYANNATATTAYTPSSSWNSTGAVNTSQKTATGTYEVSMPGIEMATSLPTVTAVNNSTSTAVACRPYFWGTGSIEVRCTNAAGTPVDSRFTVSYSSTAS